MKDTMILTDGTIIELEAGASLSALRVAAVDRAAMLDTWAKLTPANLASMQIKNGDGTVTGNFTDLVLVSETSTVAVDGSVLTDYCLREKTAEEKRLDALEEGYEVHDGAIGDMGAALSVVAEAQEGGQA